MAAIRDRTDPVSEEPEAPERPRKIVFVLGAGFTKAFVPAAPLLTDDYDNETLASRFGGFERATQLIAAERSREGGLIDIERLMTRLDGGMPYDASRGKTAELVLLQAELRDAFVRRLQTAMRGERRETELTALASYIVRNRIDCVTFNYDDVLDGALWSVERAETHISSPYWHPDGGYGFYCESAECCVERSLTYIGASSMLLHKLHGSINWRPKRGAVTPFAVESVVHRDNWRPLRTSLADQMSEQEVETLIDLHLEPDPFFVPPVLIKTDLSRQPILRLVWGRAYASLADATDVVFVGYRFPITDLAAAFLFREALSEIDVGRISIIGRPDSRRREQTKAAYRAVFPGLRDEQFRWIGTLDWSRLLIEGNDPTGLT